jgi:ElaB/YqjD/DUF883 family membrane-anchored ribosome-binding protein
MDGHRMARQSRSAVSGNEMAAIQGLLNELEQRLRRLNSAAKQEASGVTDDVNALVNEALADIAAKLRDGTQSLTGAVTDQATRMGGEALKKLGGEIERHPLATVALAAGIGFLVGLAGNHAERTSSPR